MNRNLVDKGKWCPADGFRLESEAMDTVLSDENTLVVAGPGAGKTELLAQRACFLLETNTCRYPKKILAISFKKDAAANLRERVELRCGKELALRLKYTGIGANIVVLESIPEAVDKLKSYNEKYAIAIPNYTALVETQRELEK